MTVALFLLLFSAALCGPISVDSWPDLENQLNNAVGTVVLDLVANFSIPHFLKRSFVANNLTLMSSGDVTVSSGNSALRFSVNESLTVRGIRFEGIQFIGEDERSSWTFFGVVFDGLGLALANSSSVVLTNVSCANSLSFCANFTSVARVIVQRSRFWSSAGGLKLTNVAGASVSSSDFFLMDGKSILVRSSSSLLVEDCRFFNSSVVRAVEVRDGANVTVTGSSFFNNLLLPSVTEYIFGGTGIGVFGNSTAVALIGCDFFNSGVTLLTGRFGDAVFVSGSNHKFSMENCSFVGAGLDIPISGSLVFFSGVAHSIIRLTNTRFVNGRSLKSGGCILARGLESSSLMIEDCTVSLAPKYGAPSGGIAVVVPTRVTFWLKNSTFDVADPQNTAGVIFVDEAVESSLEISDNHFIGSGIHFQYLHSTSVLVRSSSFLRCTGGTIASAVYVVGGYKQTLIIVADSVFEACGSDIGKGQEGVVSITGCTGYTAVERNYFHGTFPGAAAAPLTLRNAASGSSAVSVLLRVRHNFFDGINDNSTQVPLAGGAVSCRPCGGDVLMEFNIMRDFGSVSPSPDVYSSGGCLAVQKADNVTIRHSLFDRCSERGIPTMGGAVAVFSLDRASISLYNLTVSNADAVTTCGGILFQDILGCNITVTKVTIFNVGKKLIDSSGGGALRFSRIQKCSVTVESCNFFNISTFLGGGITMTSFGPLNSVRVVDIRISESIARMGACMAMLWIGNSSVYVSGMTCTDIAGPVTNALHIQSFSGQASVTIVNSTVSNVESSEKPHGLALRAIFMQDNSSLVLEGCTFSNTTGSQYTGIALEEFTEAASASISNCVFDRLGQFPFPQVAGALYVSEFAGSSSLLLRNCTFSRCESYISGSAISIIDIDDDSLLRMQSLAFHQVGLASKPASGGSAIFFRFIKARSALLLEDVVVQDCYSKDGAAAILGGEGTGGAAVIEFRGLRVENTYQGVLFSSFDIGRILLDAALFRNVQRAVRVLLSSRVDLTDSEFFGGEAFAVLAVDHVNIRSCQFQGCTNAVGGAAFNAHTTKALRVENCTFQDGSMTALCVGCGGGAVRLESVTGSFANVRFLNLTSATSGGGVLVGSESSVEMSGVVFSNCSAARTGGALTVSDASTTITGCTVDFCSAHSGAFVAAGGGVLVVRNATIRHARAWQASGILATVCFTVDISDVSCTDCHSSGIAGVFLLQQVQSLAMVGVSTAWTSSLDIAGSILLMDVPKCTASRLSIQNSFAGSTGGCLRAFGSHCTIADSSFHNCSTPSKGGAMDLLALTSFDLRNVTITGCSASEGGAILARDSTALTVRGSTFESNVASRGGGVLSVVGQSRLNLTATTMKYGRSGAGPGGCILVSDASSASIGDTIFEACVSKADGGAVYAGVGTAANVSASSFDGCSSGGSGGALFISDGMTASSSGCAFSENTAELRGGAVAMFGSTLMNFGHPTSFTNNDASIGGAVWFDGRKAPDGLQTSTHSGNEADAQGPFAACDASDLRITPSTFTVSSRTTFKVVVEALDIFGSPISSAKSVSAVLSCPLGTAALSGQRGKLEGSVAVLSAVEIDGKPGSKGIVRVAIDEFDLSANVEYKLASCSLGDIERSTQCVQCPYGTFSRSTADFECSTCPSGAVCVNGSNLWPSWGRWRLPNGDIRGVCNEASGECSYPSCLVKDACTGTVDVQLNMTSEVVLSAATRKISLHTGISPAVRRLLVVGMDALLDSTLWARLTAINCTSSAACDLTLSTSTAWPLVGASVRSLTLMIASACANGYTGNLCADCSPGYGRKTGAECARCLDAVVSLLLMFCFLLITLAVVSFLVLSTIRKSGKSKQSALVPVIKVAWSYFQLMAVCAQLPLNWPGALLTMFQVQETAASVNSEQIVSLDCVLGALGVSQDLSSLIKHSIFVLSLPIACMIIAGLTWWIIGIVQRRKAIKRGKMQDMSVFEVSLMDRFFISVISVLFLFYPQLCENSFALFPCEELATGERFMSWDHGVSCSSGTYTLATIMGTCGVALYVIGIPVLAFVLVRRKRHALHTRYARNTVGFLYIGYSDKCYYFESIVLIAKAIFGGLALTARVWDPVTVVVSGAFIFTAFYVLLMELKPFEMVSVDRVQRLSTLGLLCMILSGLLFSDESVGGVWRAMLVVLLISINLTVLAVVLIVVVPELQERSAVAVRIWWRSAFSLLAAQDAQSKRQHQKRDPRPAP